MLYLLSPGSLEVLSLYLLAAESRDCMPGSGYTLSDMVTGVTGVTGVSGVGHRTDITALTLQQCITINMGALTDH